MSSKIFTYSFMTANIEGEVFRFGSPFTPVTRTITGNLAYKKTATIAAAGITKMMDVANDLSDWDYLLLATDFDAYVEFVVDETNGASLETAFTLPLFGSNTAKTYGIPLILARDDAYGSDHTQATFGGTLNTIDTIRIHNVTGASNSVKALCLAFT